MQQKVRLIGGKFVVEGKEEIEPKEVKVEVKQYSLEVLTLRDKVIKGNDVLWRAWLKIRDIKDKEEKERQLDKWNVAQNRLHYFCLELKSKGYEDCLYLDKDGKKTKNCLKNPDGFWCQVCPSSISYWEKEIMSL